MKKVCFILTAVLLTGLVFMSCASGSAAPAGGGAASSAPAPAGADPMTFKFRHFLGKYIQENWNATNSNEAALGTILDHTYVFVGGRKTLDYFEYFIIEKRDRGIVTLKIKSITLIADGEEIVLDLQNQPARAAFPGAPLAPTSFADGVLTVNYPNAFAAGDNMPRLAITIPEANRPALVSAGTVSVKIVLAD